MTKKYFSALALILAVAQGPDVLADDNGRLNAQLFTPVEDDGKFIGMGDSSILPLWDIRTSFFLNYAHAPLVSVNSLTGEKTPTLKSLTTGDAMVAVGLHEVIQAALSVPLNYNSGYDAASGEAYGGGAPGDMRLRMKVQVLDPQKFPVGLAVLPVLTAPTGDQDSFVGNDGVTGGAILAADTQVPGFQEGPITVGANLGINGRKSIPTGNQVLGSEMNFGLGANVPFAPNLAWITDLYGRTGVGAPFKYQSSSPLELVTAVRSTALKERLGITITGGAGRGFTTGMGSPVFRLFAGIQYAFEGRTIDTDVDTYADKHDLCPNEPEDFDGYQDADGCPEAPVTYRGKVLAAGTRKPLSGQLRIEPPGREVPYESGYFELVTEASSPHRLTIGANGYKAATVAMIPAAGAVSDVTASLEPYPMRVILTVLAKGSRPAGRVEVFPEGTQYDFSGETLEFEVDGSAEQQAFRLVAADFQPVEGALRVVPGSVTNVTVTLSPIFKRMRFNVTAIDSVSEAPLPVTAFVGKLARAIESDGKTGRFAFDVTRPGEYPVRVVSNGYESQVTTFTTAGAHLPEYFVRMVRKEVKVVASKLVLDPIFFANGKAEILWNSYSILDSVADYMQKNPQTRFRIEGHTDDKGNAAANLRLSQQRVNSVVKYLTQKGISKNRLEPKGFGEDQPIAPNDTEENRAQNRRVEFIVIDEKPAAPAE